MKICNNFVFVKRKCLFFCFLTYSSTVLAAPATSPLYRQIDAQNQQRQKEQLENIQRQLEKTPEVRFDVPPDESNPFPRHESNCFSVSEIILLNYDNVLQRSFPSTRFQSALMSALSDYQVKLPVCLGAQGIKLLLNRVQHHIIEAGYVTTRVVVENQNLASGKLYLTVIPGLMRHTIIEDKSTWHRFTPLTAYTGLTFEEGKLLNIRDLEQSLENLRRLPTAEAKLEILPAEGGEAKLGESDVLIRYKQAFPARLTLGLDDSGTKYTGKLQGSVALSLDGLFTANDLIYGSFTHNMKRPAWSGEDNTGGRGSENYVIHYSVPVKTWLLGFTHTTQRYHQQVSAAYGSSVLYSGITRTSKMTLSKLLFRNGRHKTLLSASLWTRQSHNFINDEEIDIQRRRTAGWELGLSHRAYLGTAILQLEANYKRGTGAYHALKAPEENYNEGTSRMKIITASANFTQPFTAFGQGFYANTVFRGQWNKTPLAYPDRFSLGGRYTVRGTDGELTISGERGWVWQNEIAWNMGGFGQYLYATYDYGVVRGLGTEMLTGRTMSGTTLGLKGGYKNIAYDVFVGKSLHLPREFPKKSVVVGFSLSLNF